MLFTLILTWRHTWSPWYASDQRFLAPLQQGSPRQHLPAKLSSYYLESRWWRWPDWTGCCRGSTGWWSWSGGSHWRGRWGRCRGSMTWSLPGPCDPSPARVSGVWWQMLVSGHISHCPRTPPGLQALILRWCRGRSHSGSGADWRQIQGSETLSSGHGGKLLLIMMRIKEFIRSLNLSIISLSLTLTVSIAI